MTPNDVKITISKKLRKLLMSLKNENDEEI